MNSFIFSETLKQKEFEIKQLEKQLEAARKENDLKQKTIHRLKAAAATAQTKKAEVKKQLKEEKKFEKEKAELKTAAAQLEKQLEDFQTAKAQQEKENAETRAAIKEITNRSNHWRGLAAKQFKKLREAGLI